MSDITNLDRAAWAEGALGEFVEQSGLDRIDEYAISDLIANLGHYSDENGCDFLSLVQRGIGHWKAETADQDDPNRIDIMPAVTVMIDGDVP